MRPNKLAIRIISGHTGKPRTLFAIVSEKDVVRFHALAEQYIKANSWFNLSSDEVGSVADMTNDWIEVRTWSFSWDSYGWSYHVDMEMAS